MRDVMSVVARFCRDESGATAIEYAMMASGIGGFLAATIWGLGSEVRTKLFEKVATALG